MRRGLSRVAAVAASSVLTALLLPSGAASAAQSSDCLSTTSTRIFTSGSNRLWVDQPSPTRTLVCFQDQSLSLGGLTVVIDTNNFVTAPSVTLGNNPLLCPSVLFTMSAPVALRLAVSLVPTAVCLTVLNSTVSLQFDPGSVNPSNLPRIEVWRDGGVSWGWIDVAVCPVEYALFLTFGGPDWCMSTNARIFP